MAEQKQIKVKKSTKKSGKKGEKNPLDLRPPSGGPPLPY